MKLEIQFTSRIAGAIGAPDSMLASVDTDEAAVDGGIIAHLYKKIWEITQDDGLIPVNRTLLIGHF